VICWVLLAILLRPLFQSRTPAENAPCFVPDALARKMMERRFRFRSGIMGGDSTGDRSWVHFDGSCMLVFRDVISTAASAMRA